MSDGVQLDSSEGPQTLHIRTPHTTCQTDVLYCLHAVHLPPMYCHSCSTVLLYCCPTGGCASRRSWPPRSSRRATSRLSPGSACWCVPALACYVTRHRLLSTFSLMAAHCTSRQPHCCVHVHVQSLVSAPPCMATGWLHSSITGAVHADMCINLMLCMLGCNPSRLSALHVAGPGCCVVQQPGTKNPRFLHSFFKLKP